MTVQLTIYINYVIGYIHLTICAVDSFVTESWWRTVVVMSFLNKKRDKERDKMIEDYLTLKEKIKKRNLEESIIDEIWQKTLNLWLQAIKRWQKKSLMS